MSGLPLLPLLFSACVGSLGPGSSDVPDATTPSDGATNDGPSSDAAVPQTPYVVTNTNDSGPGSLRNGVINPNTLVTFEVGGTIALASVINIRENNITIDGTSAPSVVTLSGYGLNVESKASDNTSNVTGTTIKNLRFRNPTPYIDSILIFRNATNVLVEHCSFVDAGDGQIDITEGASGSYAQTTKAPTAAIHTQPMHS